LARYRDKILNLFHRDNRTYTAFEIAQLTEIPLKSVYTPLGRMVREGILIRPKSGLYTTNPTIGVGNVIEPFRVQNVRLVADTMDGKAIKAPEWLEYKPKVGFIDSQYFEGLGLGKKDKWGYRFQIGSKRGKLTMTITAPLGLTLYGWQFSMWWRDMTSKRYGFDGHVDWYVDRGTEWMKDVLGVDLDSMSKTMTLHTYEGHIMKMYQKAYGARGEFKLGTPTSVEAVQATLMSGLPAGHTMNTMAQALTEMKNQSNLMRSFGAGVERRELSMENLLPSFVDAMFKMIDKVEHIYANQAKTAERDAKIDKLLEKLG